MQRRRLLLLAVPCLLDGASPIEGRWRSVTTTRGGIGAVYGFQSDGTASYSSAAIVDSPYRRDGDRLILGEQTVRLVWRGDAQMEMNAPGGEVEAYTRQSSWDPADPLAGEWSGTRVITGRRLPVALQFRPDGSSMLVIYLKTTAGSYRAETGSWTMTLPGLPSRRIEQDSAGRLTITVRGGDPHAFVRF